MHVSDGEVRLYSRDLDEITQTFPEIIADLSEKSALLPSDIVLDGIICAFFEHTIQPSHLLQKRMTVKNPKGSHKHEIPVVFIACDVLYTDGRPLFRESLGARREILEIIQDKSGIHIASQTEVSNEVEIHDLFQRALAHGNDGLILKKRSSLYEFGQRSPSWLKIKRPGGSLNAVILYAAYENNYRGDMYSGFTFGIRVDDDDRFDQDFLPIGKIENEFTDEDLLKLNPLIKPLILEKFGPTLSLEPRIVVEVEFDEIRINRRTKAGYTLRFSGSKRIQWDKKISETSTLAEIEQLFNEKLTRKRLPQGKNPSFY